MPDKPAVEPFLPPFVISDDTISTPPGTKSMEEITGFLTKWPRNRHVSIRGKDSDITSLPIPANAAWIKPTIQAKVKSRQLFGMADMTELATRGRSTNSNCRSDTLKMCN